MGRGDAQSFDQAPSVATDRLESWKEIAAYLKREVRTAQRWEKEEGLPVRRHRHKRLGSVYAYKAELDAWWRNGQARLEQQEQTLALARQGRRRWLTAAMLVGGLAVLVAAGYGLWQRFRPGAHSPERVKLAVLPFVNLSGDAGQEYLADGLTEEMILQLSRLSPQRLGVIARQSSMQYKNSPKSVVEIGDELRVDYILESSVRREGNRVRIATQLVAVKDQTHLWSEYHDRDLHGLIALQEEVTRAIATKIGLALTPQELAGTRRSARPTNAEAYDLYLRGRYLFNKRVPDGVRKAMLYFQQAMQLDPSYAPAYVGLGGCLIALAGDLEEPYARAEAAARKAVELDPDLSDTHAFLAFVALHRLDWATADREFQRAGELDPSRSGLYGEYLIARGRFEELLEKTPRTVELDPVSMMAYHGAGVNYFYARRYDQAVDQFRKAKELEPDHPWSGFRLGYTYALTGRYDEAISEFRQLGELGQVGMAYTWATSGKKNEARKVLAQVLSKHNWKRDTYHVALIYAALGESDAALELINTALEQRHFHVVFLNVDPRLDPLRSDARFQHILRRAGFPP